MENNMNATPEINSANGKKSQDPTLKTLKTIRNLLIAAIVVMVLGFGSNLGYTIYYNEYAYADDFYYDDSGYEEYFEEEGGETEGEITEDGEVAY